LGRDALRWGPGATGTLALSDAPDYYDYVDAGLTGERFSYRFARVSIDPALTASELAALPPSFESRKNLFLHRFELLFGGRVAFALVEGLMVGGVEPDLAYANPFIVLHNRWAWNATHYDGIADNDFTSAAALLSLELRVNPWRYGELYGSFTINQFQTDYERTRYPGAADVIPNAFAWIAGGRGAYPLLGGWARVTAEYVYTNPWMYLRENALNSFTWRRVLPSNMAGADVYASAPLGYRYGPDAQVLYAALGWDAPGRLTLMASLERAVRGQQTIATPYDEGDDSVALKTPTGVPETTTGLGLEAAWYPLPGLSVTATLLWRSVTNAGHVSGAAARALDGCVGIAVSYPEISRRGR
jgi:hypothetical protein